MRKVVVEDGGSRASTMLPAGSCHSTSRLMSLEEENEMLQFLKLVRPDWSMPKKHGHCDVRRACEKLKDIGITDVQDLLQKVANNTINDLLSKARKPRFSRDTLILIKKEGAFWQSLNHLSEPSYRQVGLFAPVPQLLASKNLRTQHLKSSAGGRNSGFLQPVTGRFAKPHKLRPSSGHSLASHATSYSSLAESSTRSRPSTVAFTSPYGDRERREQGISDGFGMLPRLRGAKPKRTSPIDEEPWGQSMSRSAMSPTEASAAADSTSDFSATSPHTEQSPSVECSPVRARSDSNSHLSLPTAGRTRPSVGDAFHLNFRSDPHSSAPTASNASQTNDEDKDDQKVERWVSAGEAMSNRTKPRSPHWSNYKHNLLDHGEAMMREQEDLQHKKKLYQQMSLEGVMSPMRQHVARKILTRMREEKLHDPQVAMEVHQTCVSIRKNLAGMSNARKNLNAVKVEVQSLVSPEQSQKARLGLSLDFFKKSKTKHSTPEIQDGSDPGSEGA